MSLSHHHAQSSDLLWWAKLFDTKTVLPIRTCPPPAKHVSFEDIITVHEVADLRDLSPEDQANLWYTESDINCFIHEEDDKECCSAFVEPYVPTIEQLRNKHKKNRWAMRPRNLRRRNAIHGALLA